MDRSFMLNMLKIMIEIETDIVTTHDWHWRFTFYGVLVLFSLPYCALILLNYDLFV